MSYEKGYNRTMKIAMIGRVLNASDPERVIRKAQAALDAQPVDMLGMVESDRIRRQAYEAYERALSDQETLQRFKERVRNSAPVVGTAGLGSVGILAAKNYSDDQSFLDKLNNTII